MNLLHHDRLSSEDDWRKAWLEEDFSWQGLAAKEPFTRTGGSQQEFLRRVCGGGEDSELVRQGYLFECGDQGLYHILYIPDQWVNEHSLKVDLGQMQASRDALWVKIAEHLKGDPGRTVSGVYIGAKAWSALSDSQKKFSHVFVSAELKNSFSGLKSRNFKNSFFSHSIIERSSYFNANIPSCFVRCFFAGDIELEKLTGNSVFEFQDCTILNSLTLTNTEIGSISIDNCFIERMLFHSSNISNQVSIYLSDIVTIEWADCKAQSKVEFIESKVIRSIDLIGCDFLDRVTFADFHWPEVGWAVASGGSTTFFESVRITGSSPPRITFFDQAEFQKGLSIGHHATSVWRADFEKELLCGPGEPERPDLHDGHVRAVAGGCRTLRKIAVRDGNIHLEHMWQRAEIIARRSDGDCSWAEKFFSVSYGVVGDYGISIVKPLSWLALITVVMGLVYAYLAGDEWVGAQVNWNDISQGLGYSLNRTLPIGVFGADENAWRTEILGSGGDWKSIAIRLSATLQTVTSAVLIFLGVMAVRRKFKIS